MKNEAQYGKQIREMRKAKGLTQAQLAEKAGIATNSLSRYEINERQPSIEILTRIAEACDMTLGEFLWSEPQSINFDNKVDPNAPLPTGKQLSEAFERAKELFEKLDDSFLEAYADNDEYIKYYYNQLNHNGKKEALKRTQELTQIEQYTKSDDVENK